MVRLYLPLFLALLILTVPKESIGQNGQLANIHQIGIVIEDLTDDAKELGLTKHGLKNHALVLLRSKLPYLNVHESAPEKILIAVPLYYLTIDDRSKIGFYGSVMVRVFRPVTVNATGKLMRAVVWLESYTALSALDIGPATVREPLDQLLTIFAADWYRDNPTK